MIAVIVTALPYISVVGLTLILAVVGLSKLIGIEVKGNKYFDTELLRSRLQIFHGAFASRGRFSRRLVESDAQSMQLLYQANGFLDAKVEPEILDDYEGKHGDLFIRFKVREGKQTRVASLSIEGVHAFKEEELLGVIGSSPGQPYSEFGVTTDRDNILALYFNEGFPEASFTSTAENVTPNVGSTSGSAASAAETKFGPSTPGHTTSSPLAPGGSVHSVSSSASEIDSNSVTRS